MSESWGTWLAGFGWREWLVAAVLLLALYAAWAVWRLRRIGRETAPVDAVRQEPAAPPLKEEPPPAWNEPPPRFAERQIVLSLERQTLEMREELDALRGAFAALREETRGALEKAKLAQTVSPLYGDAMQMALAGESADTIAGRCGVARAEAELVVAMVNRAQGDMGDPDDSQMSFEDFDQRPSPRLDGHSPPSAFGDFPEAAGYPEPPLDEDYRVAPLQAPHREDPWPRP